MVMKKNKIMALAMLCSTFLSPVSKAHGGTKQGTEKSETQNDSDKNLQNILNKKSDNPQEMYESRWKTNDTVKYIEYFFGTVIGGGVLGYGGKKVYNKYIRNPKIKIKEIKPEKIIEEIKEIKEIEEIKPKEELTIDSIAEKIEKRLTVISTASKDSKRMRRVYKQVIESYKSQKNNEFQEIVETKISEEEQDEKQFIALFRELDDDTLNILLEGLTNKEKQFAKDNFKFYSFVWVSDDVNFVIAFAPKEKEINLEGKKGKVACDFLNDKLFYTNFNCESYNDILFTIL